MTHGPHETQRKVWQAALKREKNYLQIFSLKLKIVEKNRQIVYKFYKTAAFLDVYGQVSRNVSGDFIKPTRLKLTLGIRNNLHSQQLILNFTIFHIRPL